MGYSFIPVGEPTIYPAIIYTIAGVLLILGAFWKKDDIDKWWLFAIIGAVIIPFGYVYGFMPTMVLSSPTPADYAAAGAYLFGVELIDLIPKLIALGGLVIFLGFLKRDENGKFLMLSGGLFAGGYIVETVRQFAASNYTYLLTLTIPERITYMQFFNSVFLPISAVLIMAGAAVLLIYGLKQERNYFFMGAGAAIILVTLILWIITTLVSAGMV